jgi:hypothetical protein
MKGIACSFPSVSCLMLCLLLVVGGPASAQDPMRSRFVRQSLHEFAKDPQKLQSLIDGVREMKRRNASPKDSAEYRTSWEYWANIHGYPGTKDGTVAQWQAFLTQRFPEDAPLLSGFFQGMTDFTPPDQLATDIWGTCVHSRRGDPEPSHFFTWHRMYLYFFERVLRAASGNPNFALPYWDYTNNKADVAQPASAPWRIPAAFLAQPPNTPAPLFERRRTAGFGDAVQLDTDQTDIDSVLGNGKFVEFQPNLERGLHGFIHCAVGNQCLAPYIGLVPFAGNDPLFWHHHANIDRLWECWTTKYGRDANPTNDADWMKQSFKFVNEKGELVEMKVSDLFDPAGPIDYTYDNVTQCFRKEPPLIVAAAKDTERKAEAAQVTKTEIAVARDVRLDNVDQKVLLNPASAKSSAEDRKRALGFAAQPTGEGPTKTLLRLNGVEMTGAPPGASVSVFLANRTGDRRKFVGVISFFGLAEHQLRGHAAGGGRDFSFDVSTQVQELLAGRSPDEEIHVSFVATSGLAGQVPAVSQERYQKAGLRVREIKLEVEPAAAPR